MLRFNGIIMFIAFAFGVISIHLMLRFNRLHPGKTELLLLFQYILCCGSTVIYGLYTFVLFRFQYILCCGSTFTCKTFMNNRIKFQYILCCGSTKLSDSSLILAKDFNTSYVAVQPCFFKKNKWR